MHSLFYEIIMISHMMKNGMSLSLKNLAIRTSHLEKQCKILASHLEKQCKILIFILYSKGLFGLAIQTTQFCKDMYDHPSY